MGAARALLAALLTALLPPAARADAVSWPSCWHRQHQHKRVRALGPLPDHNATTLVLLFCNITEIKPDYFDGLPNLKRLSVAYNNIRHVDPAVFITVNHIQELAIKENLLVEVPNFGSLLLFPNMTHLELNHNRISALDNPETFASMIKLERLDFNDNHIEHLHSDIFKPLINLKYIDLSENKITNIADGIFHNPSLKHIFLSKNLITYVAPGAIRSGELEILDLDYNNITYLPEHFLWNLKKTSASLEFMGVFYNPWQPSCLMEVLVEAAIAVVNTSIPDTYVHATSDELCSRTTQEEIQSADPAQVETQTSDPTQEETQSSRPTQEDIQVPARSSPTQEETQSSRPTQEETQSSRPTQEETPEPSARCRPTHRKRFKFQPALATRRKRLKFQPALAPRRKRLKFQPTLAARRKRLKFQPAVAPRRKRLKDLTTHRKRLNCQSDLPCLLQFNTININ